MEPMTHELKMSRNLAVALEYCDPSGLEPDDLKIYESINFLFTVTDWAEDSTDINGRCDFTGLYDHCVTIGLTEKQYQDFLKCEVE